MIELRFHLDLYAEQAVRDAADAFGEVATVLLERDGEWLVARLEAFQPEQEGRTADEFANYVLGLTVDARDEAGGLP